MVRQFPVATPEENKLKDSEKKEYTIGMDLNYHSPLYNLAFKASF